MRNQKYQHMLYKRDWFGKARKKITFTLTLSFTFPGFSKTKEKKNTEKLSEVDYWDVNNIKNMLENMWESIQNI